VFPMIFFAGWGIIVGLYVLDQLRRRREAGDGLFAGGLISLLHPDHRKLLAGCIVAGGILLPTSMVVAGPDSYKEFVAHISVHKNTPLTNHMGLQTMLVHDWEGRMRFTRDDNLDDPFQTWKQGRLDRHNQTKPIHYAILAGIMLWMVWALRRTKLLWVGMALSCLLVMSAVQLTCYYFSMFILAAALARARPGLGPVVLIGSGASMIIGSAGSIHSMFYWIDDKFTAQSYLFFLFGALLLYAHSRPFSVERLKAWWERRPEPRPKPKPVEAPAERALPAE
jgi:hypothetical protein